MLQIVDPIFGYDVLGDTLCCLCNVIWLIIWIYLIFWIYHDAERRGSSGVLWAVLLFLFGWFFGLSIIIIIIWLIVRGPLQSRVKHVYRQAPPPSQAQAGGYCPACGKKLRHIPQYNRWYCDHCKQYK